MTVAFQPLSICKNKLDLSFFSLIIVNNSVETIAFSRYWIIITEKKLKRKC